MRNKIEYCTTINEAIAHGWLKPYEGGRMVDNWKGRIYGYKKGNHRVWRCTKQNPWHGVDTESFVDGVRTGELDAKRIRKCDACGELVDIDKDSSSHGNCNQVWGRRGWRQLGEYDG